MFRSLRQIYWRLKYRPGRVFEFCVGRDFFNDVLIVENRVASNGTLVYRVRGWCPWGEDGGPFGPKREDTVLEMIRRAKNDDW